ncbi:MAG: rhodanese-like domain-containing protein [Pseudolysinimonas sp.]
MGLKYVSRDELQRRLGEVVLIEALPTPHYELEHLPTAVNLPGVPTAEAAAALIPDPTSPVVVYCSGLSCTRSRATAIGLQKLGYTDVAVYEGGKADWTENGLQLETAASPSHSK